MKALQNLRLQRKDTKANGFGMTEALVAVSAGTLVIAGGALALRTTGTLVNQATEKTILRQNTNNGMRLLRSEIERGLHIIINNNQNEDLEERFKLNSATYQDSLSNCKEIASANDTFFNPLFGIKMAEIIAL